MSHILSRHSDIRRWVAAHAGRPRFGAGMDAEGRRQRLLQITFDGRPAKSAHDWEEWLAELDRQNLALNILDDAGVGSDFEFVKRGNGA